ncbi:hypothetical protein [Tardiphaga sp. 813_E8_N1_3]|jgi:hypothetical protein|uniref:hypothetical protein n=1 Tax=Tardiphaga sp. 813_E8_N1_3 TaxID=3240760 RepID=UPI003F2735DE
MADDEWISITDAAARLSKAGDAIDRSSLSRYLKQHSEALPVQRQGKSNLVEFGALQMHRSENVRIRSSAVAEDAAPGGTREQGTRFRGSQSEGTARKAQADALWREMDVAERIGTLTPVAEIDKGARDAFALMLSAFDRAIDTEAASASVKYGWDERIARLVLKNFIRKGTDVFHGEMLKQLDAIKRVAMAAEHGDDRPVETALQ